MAEEEALEGMVKRVFDEILIRFSDVELYALRSDISRHNLVVARIYYAILNHKVRPWRTVLGSDTE